MKNIVLGDIPFYYDMQKTPHNPSGIPDKFSFNICEDDNGVIIQQYSEDTDAWLESAYKLGSNVSGLMDDVGIGNEYAQDFKQFIMSKIQNIRGKKVLDIGCGTGYLLKLLGDCGAIVEGVEPGEYGNIGRERYSLNIKKGFFNKKDYKEKFDIIIFYGVLEHIRNYKQFLEDVMDILVDDGVVFLSVPDCEEYLRHGNASVFTAVHWNYFTEASLRKLLCSVWGKVELKHAGYGGAIYSCFKKDNEGIIEKNESDLCFEDIQMKIDIMKRKVKDFFNNHVGNNIGVYCPGRIINYYENIMDAKTSNNIRFFDDDQRFRGLYYPSIPIKMENYDDLKVNPVDVMLIASTTFGESIKKKCNDIGIKECYLLKEI